MAIGLRDILIPYLGYLCWFVFVLAFIMGMFVTMVWDLSRTKPPNKPTGADVVIMEQRPASEQLPRSPAECGLANLDLEESIQRQPRLRVEGLPPAPPNLRRNDFRKHD